MGRIDEVGEIYAMRIKQRKSKFGGFAYNEESGQFKIINGNFVFEYDCTRNCFRINKNPFYEIENPYLDMDKVTISHDSKILQFEIKSKNSEYRIYAESKIGFILNRVIFDAQSKKYPPPISRDAGRHYTHCSFYFDNEDGFVIHIFSGGGFRREDSIEIFNCGYELFYNQFEPFGRVKVDSVEVVDDKLIVRTGIGDRTIPLYVPSEILNYFAEMVNTIHVTDLPPGCGHVDSRPVPRII